MVTSEALRFAAWYKDGSGEIKGLLHHVRDCQRLAQEAAAAGEVMSLDTATGVHTGLNQHWKVVTILVTILRPTTGRSNNLTRALKVRSVPD